MTNKQKIIDDVDVSKCRYFTSEWDFNNCGHICKGTECKYKRLWYKKQLKRKEQEYEDLRQYHNKCCEEFKKEKQDLIDKYNQLSINFYDGDYCNTEHCSLLKSKEKECEYERWKPEPNEEYYYVSENGKIVQTRNCGWEPAANKVKFYNCFKSEKQAEQEAEKILVRRQLEDIARRLNKGQKINWNDDNQIKYCIRFDFPLDMISICARLHQKLQGSVYCLSDKFKNVAIQEIGEDRLRKYLKGE